MPYMLFASLISRLFDPFIIFFVILYLIALQGGLTGISLVSFLFTVLIAVVLPPVGLLYFAVKKKLITNWDISDRKQRVRAFIVFSILFVIDFLIIRTFHNAIITQVFTEFLIWFIGFFLITLFWKLSGHTGVATLFIGLIMYWYGIQFWPLIMIIPLIAWSRVVLKRHTIAQVAGGVVYSIIFLYEFRSCV